MAKRNFRVEFRIAPTRAVGQLPWECPGTAASLEGALKVLKRAINERNLDHTFQHQIWNRETRQTWCWIGGCLVETTDCSDCSGCGAPVPERQEAPYPGHHPECHLVAQWNELDDIAKRSSSR